MPLPDNHDLLLTGINVLVVLVVVFHLQQEISALLVFLTKTAGDSRYRLARVHRGSSRVAFGLAVVTAALAWAMEAAFHIQPQLLVAFGALLVGFFVSGLLYQICFVNETGLGAVSSKFEMEIQWNEVMSYEWKDHTLLLRLKSGMFPRRKIRFRDSEIIPAVNERLKMSAVSDHLK